MNLSDRIKDKVSLHQVASDAGVAWDMAQSRPQAGDWWAPCPFHHEQTASFHVTEKPGRRGVFKCHGCGAAGSVIDFAMTRNGGDFSGAVRALASFGGLEDEDPAQAAARRKAAEEKAQADDATAAEKGLLNLGRARAIWQAALPDHPAVAAYLTGRGIDLAAIGGVPASLRFAPDLPARDKAGRVVHRGPAMVAFIGRDRFFGVHRTWIDGPARARVPDGAKVPKAMLGQTGAIFGQPVRLTPYAARLLIVGEGIETTLAKLGAMRRRGVECDAEAAMTLGALAGPDDPANRNGACPRSGKRLPSPDPLPGAVNPGWLPPDGAQRVMILADPSTKSPEAARLNGARAARKAAAHCERGAQLAVPRGHFDHDDDFADLALNGELK